MVVPHTNRYYLAVAIGLVTLVALAYGGAFWLMHRAPLDGTTVPSAAVIGTPGAQTIPPNVTVVPIPTIDPQPLPTPIFEGTAPIGQLPVPWKVTKQVDPQFHRTYWMAPPEVVSQVRQDFQEMDAFYRAHIFNLSPNDERQFITEPLLSAVMAADQQDLARGEARGRADLIRPELQVLGFNAAGNEVQVAQEVHGELVPVCSLKTHQIIREEHSPIGIAVSTLVYDANDHRWKVSETSFVPGPPGLQ